MPIPNDVARCPGVTEVNAAQPIRLCATCDRWRFLGTGGPRTPNIQPAIVIRADGNGAYLFCENRIAAG